MGIFDLFKKKETSDPDSTTTVKAAVSGRIVPMAEIEDEAFQQGAMGFCCGIVPTDGHITAPMSGSIMQVADTYHALGVSCDNGVQVIIHVGMDTAELRGKGFRCHVREGEPVQAGQPLLTVDLDQLRSDGYSDTVVMAILNTDEFSSITLTATGIVSAGDDIMCATRDED